MTSEREGPKRYSSSEKTRRSLMLAAENLVGQHGLAGVSARAVAKQAKILNNCAVQYHFGSLNSLFGELAQFRMMEMEPKRKVMLEKAGHRLGSPIEPKLAMEAICLPHLELRSRAGDFPYANFLSQYLPQRFPNGFAFAMKPVSGSPKIIGSLIADLQLSLEDMPREIFERRLANASILFFNTLRSMRIKGAQAVLPEDVSTVIEDTLNQAVGALTASLPGTCRNAE